MKKATLLIQKHLHNELNPEEQAEFEKWLYSDEKNQKLFDEYAYAWKQSELYPEGFQVREAEALETVHNKAGIQKHGIIFPALLKIAAAAAIITGITFLIKPAFFRTHEEVLVFNSDSAVKEIILPDQTHVWLNKYSELQYPRNFKSSSRTVKLNGEAYFEVFRNKKAPFTVQLRNSEVQVLGTHFNIKEDNGSTNVSVIEGKVKFTSKNTNHFEILTANESALLMYNGNKLVKTKFPDPNFMAWQSNLFTFNDYSLKEVLGTISEHYRVKAIIYRNNKQDIRISGVFKNRGLPEVLQSLSEISNINFSFRNDTILVQ